MKVIVRFWREIDESVILNPKGVKDLIFWILRRPPPSVARLLRMTSAILISILIAVCSAAPGFAQTLSSTELIENAKELDGAMVLYKGEVVTAIMRHGTHSWITVNDGPSAIGIWAENSLAKNIKFVGDYKYKGDTVEVEGIFNRACSAHGGELDIHAEKIAVLERGSSFAERPYGDRIRIAIALFLATLIAVAFFRKKL